MTKVFAGNAAVGLHVDSRQPQAGMTMGGISIVQELLALGIDAKGARHLGWAKRCPAPPRCRAPGILKTGFTLVEVMLALTISSFILTAAFGTFRISMDVSKRAGVRRNALENCRSALGIISRDLAGAFLSSTETWSLFVGEDASVGDLNTDTLAFTAMVNSPERTGERTSDYAEVEYYVDMDPDTPEEWLVRRYDCRPDDDLREGGITSLAGYQVVSLEVWYFTEGEWAFEWDSQKELPTVVRVEISAIIDPKRGLDSNNLVTLSSIVWLPHSQA